MSTEWEEGFKAGYDFCEMLSKVESYRGEFWPPAEKGLVSFRHGFAEGTITGRGKFNVNWKWVQDDKGNVRLVEKI